MTENGSFIGYNHRGEPVSVATYGEQSDTRIEARSFAASGGLYVREFEQGDPELKSELDRWRELILEKHS